MLTPLILFFGLAVATAVIAHWSDNLGKKLGKKRVSLMGLRPRTTATVLTVASSWCIMIFTLAAMLLAVAPLRNMLFSYDAERARAEDDRERAARDRERADSQIQEERRRIKATQIEYDKAATQLSDAKGRLDKANQEVTRSQQAASEAVKQGHEQASRARAQAATAEKAAAEARKDVVREQSRVAAAQTQFVIARQREAAATQRERAAQGETRIAERETQAAERERQAAQRATKSALSSKFNAEALTRIAGREDISIRKSLAAAQQRLKLTQQQTNLLKNEGKLLQVQINELRSQRDEAQSLAEQVSRFADKDAPIKVGQVFAATRIVANQPLEVVVAQLRDLLQQGRETFARSEDSAPIPNFPADASLQMYPLDAPDANGKLMTLQGDEILRYFANAIRHQTVAKSVSVRLLSVRNYLAGEKEIGVQFETLPVKPAFDLGETLASVTIDGSQGDARIFSSLLDLLEFGQQQARRRGVNPPLLITNSDFYSEDTKAKLFEALRRIEVNKSRVNVNLVTARALTTVEPLQVRFEIEGIKGQPTS